jgi:WD40 repeat protein
MYYNSELINTINGNGETEFPRKLISLDKMYLAVGYGHSETFKIGKTIRILNWETGGEFGKLVGHSLSVRALTKLEDSHLASGSIDSTIKIWHWRSGGLLQNLTGHTNDVNMLISMRNFTILVSCSEDMTIKLWNRTNGTVIQTLKYQYFTLCVLLLNNGHLARGALDSKIYIWDIGTSKANVIRTLTGQESQLMSLANIDQLRMASCAINGEIIVWRVDLGTAVKTLLGHPDWVYDLILLPNGHLASGDSMIYLWDLEKYSLVKIIRYCHKKPIYCFDLLPNGNLVSGSQDGTIKIWYFDQKSTNYTKSKKHHFLILELFNKISTLKD